MQIDDRIGQVHQPTAFAVDRFARPRMVTQRFAHGAVVRDAREARGSRLRCTRRRHSAARDRAPARTPPTRHRMTRVNRWSQCRAHCRCGRQVAACSTTSRDQARRTTRSTRFGSKTSLPCAATRHSCRMARLVAQSSTSRPYKTASPFRRPQPHPSRRRPHQRNPLRHHGRTRAPVAVRASGVAAGCPCVGFLSGPAFGGALGELGGCYVVFVDIRGA